MHEADDERGARGKNNARSNAHGCLLCAGPGHRLSLLLRGVRAAAQPQINDTCAVGPSNGTAAGVAPRVQIVELGRGKSLHSHPYNHVPLPIDDQFESPFAGHLRAIRIDHDVAIANLDYRNSAESGSRGVPRCFAVGTGCALTNGLSGDDP